MVRQTQPTRYRMHRHGASRTKASLGFKRNRNGPEFHVKFELLPNGRIKRIMYKTKNITNANYGLNSNYKKIVNVFNRTNNRIKNFGNVRVKNVNWTNVNRLRGN